MIKPATLFSTHSHTRVPLLLIVQFLLLVMLSSGLQSAEYDGKNGFHQVKIIPDLVITDQSRNRKIPIKIYYPDSAGPFPVILYSHGLGGSRDNKKYLGNYWASHGYVGIFMTHFGSDSSLIDRTKTRREIFQALRKAARSPKAQMDRPQDVTSVINALAGIEKMAPQLKGKLEPTRIGVSGHSYGAYTTLASAGAWAGIAREKSNIIVLDKRPAAFLAMSPRAVQPNRDPQKVFGKITRPMMTMTGSNDTSPITKGMTGKDRLQPFLNMPPGDKYSLWMEDAYHWTFGDGRSNRTPKPEHHRFIKICSLAFWDAYLKNSEEARRFLKSRTIEKLSAGEARLDFR